ncbi:receptor-like tyrosine-protein kinase kin-16 [Procambarus clarkii]|uniref:receptor-like tyrosine-protein kinase kin-16 n=1 Tax=Procambarus clarkii TaxID=6728 RepID=UPI001E66FE40|nr:receptor-like tyrosine-protein kinase kin-16 [Procambarus clarkii]
MRRQVAHNDIKLDNVCIKIVKEFTQATLIDFGLSTTIGKKLYTIPRTEERKAKTPWMAPEVLNAKRCNDNSDIFSFALCCTKLLGRLKATFLPKEVIKWLKKAMHKEPENRPSTDVLRTYLREMTRPLRDSSMSEDSTSEDVVSGHDTP